MKRILLFISFAILIMSFIRFNPSTDKLVVLNKFTDPVIREITNLKHDRKTFLILPYLQHTKAAYREEAAMAYASLQDTVILNYLLPLLNDPDAGVRNATAFAVGQIGDTNLEGNLINAFYAESNSDVKASILKAMGKCANDRILISFNMLHPKDSVVSAGLAWGIYFAGLKDKTSEALLKKSINLLNNNPHEETKLAIAHYLSRTKNLNLEPFEKEIASALQKESNANIRMPLCLALGKTKGKGVEEQLNKLIVSDPDYRVRVNAIKALELLDKGGISNEIFQALSDKNINTAFSAAEYIKRKAEKHDVPEILVHLENAKNWRVYTTLLAAAIKNSSDVSMEEKTWNRYKKTKNIYEKGYLLRALANNPINNNEISREIFQTKEPVIRTYGIEALVEACERNNNQELKKEYFDNFKKAIESTDIALIGTSAVVLRNPELNLDQYISNPTFLFKARDRLKLPQDIETYQEIQKTIDYVTKSTSTSYPRSLSYVPIDWELISSLASNQKVRVKTSKGDFVLELMVEDAPGTVSNFLKLSNKNFFNNKNFHRVVPNFVVQGGDPRGDGWGSSDGIIRSEFNMSSFNEGYVGMASAGKDTESCQWFIMHSPAPHLDGRYTNFAKVILGISVVHQLEVGDYIKSIEKIL
jgi:cyclophilin family peptidyl-prolyl cis-trans isomerase/HEAT repeat protein